MQNSIIGKQEAGTSHISIKKMAEKAMAGLSLKEGVSLADIGAGLGASSRWLWPRAEKVWLVDHAVQRNDLPAHVQYKVGDLNDSWPLETVSVDLLISLEVIEHLENPRRFFREMHRVLVPGGTAFISTPHNLNLMARLLFLLKGQHRHFQDLSYPAHITPLLPVDFKRLAKETGFTPPVFFYNHFDVLPLFKTGYCLPFPLFSNTLGIMVSKLR